MLRRLAWPLILVLTAAGVARAQATTGGTITGQVVDAQGAVVPGALVTVISAQGPRSFATDSNGRFLAPYLTPGRYLVRVELAGFSLLEQKDVEVRLGQRVDLAGLRLEVGSLEETVELAGSPPVVDVGSTTTGGVLDSDVLKRLPVGRNFTDTLYLVPGVTTRSTNPSIGGASGLDNSYVVDGVNITDTGYGAMGSYSTVFGSMGIGVTTDFVEETQVKTGGFEAEYGEATGGVVNVVTRSGGNALHGSVYGFFRPAGLESDWRRAETSQGTVNTTASGGWDAGLSLGGPVVRDQLFFFGAFNPQYQSRTLVAPEGFPLASLGEQTRKRRVLSYAGKLTWQLSAGHRLELSAFGDPSRGDEGPQRANALLRPTTDGLSALEYGGHNQGLRYDGILTSGWLVELSAARSSSVMEELPSVDSWRVIDYTRSPRVISGGIGFYEDNRGTNVQLGARSTHIFDAAGHHQVRYGLSWQDIEYTVASQRTGPPFKLPNGLQTNSGANVTVRRDPTYGQIYTATGAYISEKQTLQQHWAFFLQDTWQIGRRLTIRPGLRYERQLLTGSAANPLCHADDSSPGAADGSGPLVPCQVEFDGNWAPRLGATYDLRGDGRSKVFASWGRFYVRMPNDIAVRALSADAAATADYFDAGLTRPVPDGVLALGSRRHLYVSAPAPAVFSNNARLTYQDELLGGVEFDVGRGVNVGLRYIHRSLGRVLEDATAVPIGWCELYGADVPGNPGLDACSIQYLIQDVGVGIPAVLRAPGYPDASFEDPVHTYDSLELTANKTFSDNWALLASYRWSRLKGNYEGFFRADNGQSDPGITSLFDFPTNDPGYTEIMGPRFGYAGDIRYQGCSLGCGVLPNDRTHQLKVFASYAWSALNLGLGLTAGSGQVLTGLWAHPFYGTAGEIPDSVRGSGFQTSEGFKQRGHPDISLDLHADYTLRLDDSRRLVLIVDVFNVANRQEALWYNSYHDLTVGVPNPDFGQPAGTTAAFSAPRVVRLGARFEF